VSVKAIFDYQLFFWICSLPIGKVYKTTHKWPLSLLKGVKHEVFNFRVFKGSVSPWPLSILLGPFQIFMKIRGVFALCVYRRYLCLLTGVNCRQCPSYLDKLSLVPVTEVIKPCPGFSWIPWHQRLIYHYSNNDTGDN
jgi:hypothetical protein